MGAGSECNASPLLIPQIPHLPGVPGSLLLAAVPVGFIKPDSLPSSTGPLRILGAWDLLKDEFDRRKRQELDTNEGIRLQFAGYHRFVLNKKTAPSGVLDAVFVCF